MNTAVINMLQRHMNRLLEYGAFGFTKPEESIKEGKTWHITALGTALYRTALLMEAVQLLQVLGIQVNEHDIIDVDCCHSYVPWSMHVADGPGGEDDFQWVISWCTQCPEGQSALEARV